MKFAEAGFDAVLAGQKTAKEFEFTVPGSDKTAKVALVPLSMGDEVEIARKAREFAADPAMKDGDAVYDYGVAVHTLLLAARDTEKIEEHFFASVAELMSLPREFVIFLHEQQQHHQDALSPWTSKMSMEEMFVGLHKLAAGGSEGDLFFIQQRPGMRLTFTRFLASLCKSLLEPSSPDGSPSEPITSPSPTNTEKKPSGKTKKAAREIR